jgi:hypothetical protein
VALTGEDADVPLENQRAIRVFFESFGPRIYGTARIPVSASLVKTGIARKKSVLIARWKRSELLAKVPGLRHTMITGTYQIAREGYGLLEKATYAAAAIGTALRGRVQPAYDLGAPLETTSPWLYVYVIDPEKGDAAGTRTLPAEFHNYTAGAHSPASLEPGKPYPYSSRPGEVIKLQIPISVFQGDLLVNGFYRVDRGGIVYGISDLEGHDVWNTSLEATSGWQRLPLMPVTALQRGNDYLVFFFANDKAGVEFSVRDLAVEGERVVLLPGFRRFGALGW